MPATYRTWSLLSPYTILGIQLGEKAVPTVFFTVDVAEMGTDLKRERLVRISVRRKVVHTTRSYLKFIMNVFQIC